MISARKYNIIFVIQLLLIVGVLGGGGYLVYQNVTEKNNKEEVIEEEITVPDLVELDQEIVEVDINENVVYDGYDVNIRIPKVTDEKAESINEQIKSDLDEYYRNKDHSINYEYYVNNDVISILITITDNNENYYYLSYNFNKDDFKLLTNSELLELKEIKEEDFHGILINIYDDHLKSNLEEGKEIDQTTISYKKTIDKDNCDLDRPMFLDHDNHLNVVFEENDEEIITKYIYNLNSKKVVER